MLWEKNKETADQLLHQANSQFHREQDRLNLDRLCKSIEDTAVIFHRIVNNTEILKTADRQSPGLSRTRQKALQSTADEGRRGQRYGDRFAGCKCSAYSVEL